RALLAKKGGNARLTEWMKDGFARAVAMRLNPGSAATDRAAVRRLAPKLAKTAKVMPVVDKAWSGTGKDKDLIAASLMDFLTFGAGSEKFGTLLSALIPSDAIASPTFADALKGADWMVEDLDRAWRDWLAAGSPAGKGGVFSPPTPAPGNNPTRPPGPLFRTGTRKPARPTPALYGAAFAPVCPGIPAAPPLSRR